MNEVENYFRLRFLLSSTVTENPKPPGLIVVGDSISYIHKGKLKPDIYQKLIQKGILFSYAKMEKLLKVLDLYKKMTLSLEEKTKRLPEQKLDVFGKITVHEDNEKLEVRCHIVYGNPVQATIGMTQ